GSKRSTTAARGSLAPVSGAGGGLCALARRRNPAAIAGQGPRSAAPVLRSRDHCRRTAPAEDRAARRAGLLVPADLHLLSPISRARRPADPDDRPRRGPGAVGVRPRRAA